tara:strand:+ start:329 stop:838 length:510 start_codon:yes stop_codon:yes gene_type:complete
MNFKDPIIIDDFLDHEDFLYLANIARKSHYAIPENIVRLNKPEPNNHILLVHMLYDNFAPRSDYFRDFGEKLFSKFPEEFSVEAIIRSKINCYPQTSHNVTHRWHQDAKFSHKGALFSLNDCNGSTEIMGYGKIESKANRLILFDPSVPHRSYSCTDQKFRFNVIINYF